MYDTVTTLNASAGRQWNWSLDAVGNWNSTQNDGTTTIRTNNQQNVEGNPLKEHKRAQCWEFVTSFHPGA